MSGSLVRYIDESYGRETLVELLSVTRQARLLAILGASEERLLADWARWVRGDSSYDVD